MAFTPDTMAVIVQPIGGEGIRFFSYRTDDDAATVTAADYFRRVRSFGADDSDLVFVTPLVGAAEPYTLVLEVNDSGDGTGTLSEADTAVQPSDLPAATLLYTNRLNFDALRGSDDTQDFWPFFKALLENPSSERDAILNGAQLFFPGGREYRALTRPLITLPRRLHLEMAGSAFIDFTDCPGQFSDDLMTYNGRLGYPVRPTTGDYPYGTAVLPFAAGTVAARGWEVGDRLLIRATEGLSDQLVGAFQKQEYDTLTPATFNFFTPFATYASGDGVISTDDGKSYRCTVPHTAGATMNTSFFAITGLNAISEDIYIETIVGDTVYFTSGFEHDYTTAMRPVVTKYEDGGQHYFQNFTFVGNHPTNVIDRGIWLTGTSYGLQEMAYPDGVSGASRQHYECIIPHVAGNFLTDVAAGRWRRMGADRVFQISMSDKFHLEGGSISRASGYGMLISSVGDFILRDHVGYATNKRSSPGGWLALCGGYNSALIENVTVHSGSQPFMTTESGDEYGVRRNTVWRDCRSFGGNSAFTQHHQETGAVYENCGHDGVGSNPAPGGSSFDIRTPSRLLNCWVRNTKGRAIVLRHNFGGFGRNDNTDTGTEIHSFEAHDVTTGIDLDNQMYNPGAGTIAWPTGRLEIRNTKLTRIGGTGSNGAVRLMWSVGTGGVVGTGPYPTLGQLHMENVLIDMKSDQHAVRIAGRWDRPTVRNVKISPSVGFTPSGAFRSFWIYNAGVAGENRPINPDFGDGNSAVGGFAAPQYSVLRTDTIPTLASATTLIPDTLSSRFYVSGAVRIDFIANANIYFGREITLVFQSNPVLTHNGNGAGGSASVRLQGKVNFATKADDTITIFSDGLIWWETGRSLS